MGKGITGLSSRIGTRVSWPLLCLILLLLFNLVFTEGFFRIGVAQGHLVGDIITILNYGSQVMVLSLGMTLVIATGGVDLSVGAVMAMAGALAAFLVRDCGVHFLVGAGAGILMALLAGAWNAVLVAGFRIQPIVATLVLMVAGRGIAKLITGGQIIDFTDPGLAFFGSGNLLYLPFEIWIAVAMFAAAGVLTRQTALGLMIESVGENETASYYTGIRSRIVKGAAYVVTGFCAGIAGLMAAGDIKAADAINAGRFIELDTILAVVVGGTALTGGRFNLTGSIIGALLIQTLTTTLIRQNVPPEVAPVPKAIVIILVCLLQSPEFRARLLRPFRRGSA